MSFRIMGGEFKGRIMKSGKHPDYRVTTGAVREALFSSLADRVPGSRFLDLFAGCGSVGLEAMSRGSASVLWVEKVPRLAACVRSNIALLASNAGPDRAFSFQVRRGDALGMMDRLTTAGERFDIIFADPPYHRGMAAEIVGRPAAAELLARGGLLVVEHGGDERFLEPAEGLELVKNKRYGKAMLSFFRPMQYYAMDVST